MSRDPFDEMPEEREKPEPIRLHNPNDPHCPFRPMTWRERLGYNTAITELKMLAWSPAEHAMTLLQMRTWRRGHLAFALVFTIIALANPDMRESSVLLAVAGLLGILYVATTWVTRIFRERKLIGPLTWFWRYPLDLLEIV